MGLKKKDFIEIEFTGRVKEGDIFDSNRKEDLKKMNETHGHEHKHHLPEPKPFIFSLGEGMFLQGVDDFLLDKEISKGKKINIELTPEKGFGPRQLNLIQLMPMRIFKEKNINPVPGIMFNFDGRPAKILSVSGGRVRVDFNNPLAGKTVVYDIKILRKVEDLNEKIKAFIDFLFRQEIKFTLDEKNKKLTLYVDKQMLEFGNLFKDKFKDLFDLDLEVKEKTEPKKPEKKDSEEEKETKR